MFKKLMEGPEKMFEMFRIKMKQACVRVVTELIKTELTHFLGRRKYERKPVSIEKKNYRNGSYKQNYTVKNVGELEIEVARDRNGKFNSKLINKYERYEKAIEKDMVLMFLSGLSTRSISLISKSLLDRKISASPGPLPNVSKPLIYQIPGLFGSSGRTVCTKPSSPGSTP